MVALKHFPNIDKEKAMSRPILYSNWLSKVSKNLKKKIKNLSRLGATG